MKLGDYTRQEIFEALAGKRGRESLKLAKELAERFSVSVGHIYKITHGVRLNGRARRHDAGEKRIELAPEIDLFMEGLTVDADFSADHVLWVTSRHFGLPADFVSITTYNQWLREKHMSRNLLGKDLRPYRSFESPRANHMHHYDTTVAEAFYANDDGSIGHEPGYERYKNKPGNRRPRLVLYSLVDDFSRVIFARFYFSENTLNLLDFVFRAWSEKEDRSFPFFGIPNFLYCDQGAPRRSAKFLHAKEKLGFEIPDTTPSHATEFGPRKHGKVERTFGEGLLGEFMKITRIFRFAEIDEMNQCLYDWLIHTNNKKNRTTNEVRFARWVRSVGAPRSMPSEEMFKLLHYDRDERVVKGNLQIELNGRKYQLPYRKPFINWVGVKIEVYWYPGKDDTISVVYDHHEEEVRAMAPVVDLAMEYKKIAATDREKRLAELKGANYSAVNFPAMYAPEKDLPYLPKRGQEFDDKRISEKSRPDGRPSFTPEVYLDEVEAAFALKKAGFFDGDKAQREADRAWLKALFSGREKIPESELSTAIEALKTKQWEAEG
ncbi:MAG: hypothetical protein A3G41_08845 [Elusimicrobia bacterium RIFCSPLOWO2_12_FULL_59_9]|nr:MAG: hypothetical protein A3G41_08845 [Elusimicrobia bacterium RIFCSPLOWO2_12_FULL_59_9]